MIKDERFLDAMPGTNMNIWTEMQIRRNTVRDRVKLLHEQGKCHISGWDKAKNGTPLPIYSAGQGVDVPMPLSMLKRERREESATAQQSSLPTKPATWLDALIYLNGWPA